MKRHKESKIIKPTCFYEEAIKRYNILLLLRKEKEEALIKAPEGKIRISNIKETIKFYLRKNTLEKSGTYISKKDKSTIKTYVQKSYDEKVLKIINEELYVLSKFLGVSDEVSFENKKQLMNIKNKDKLYYNPNRYIIQLQQAYSDNPTEVKQYINPIDISDEDYIRAWLNTEYEGKELAEDLPWYETDRKERVRSKSELNIANALAKNKIPYKYECPFVLKNGKVIYPDFTVLDVKERKEMYWEHRGMMDDVDYARHAVARNKTYLVNGVVVGKNLIITEETSDKPLGTNEIKTIIKELLLNK